MIHHQWAEIAAEKRSPFKPHRGLAAPDLFLNTMLNWRTWKACSINHTEALGNIYGNGSQTYCLKGKTYKDAQLGELVQSIVVKDAPEHEAVSGSEPIEEARGEGETAAKRQPPRASSCEATTWSWEWWLGVARTPLQKKHKSRFLACQMLKWFYDTSNGTAMRAACCSSLLERAYVSRVLAMDEHGGH
jgi:hypothetical protein